MLVMPKAVACHPDVQTTRLHAVTKHRAYPDRLYENHTE